MRIIATGGTGMLGRPLSIRLADSGHEVIVLSRSPGTKSGFPAGVRLERWDARSADGWGELADGADAIINLAGENIAGSGFLPARWTPERKKKLRQSRLDAGAAVLDAVQRAQQKPKVVLQASGLGIYGVDYGDTLLDESAAPGRDFLSQLAIEWEGSTAPVREMGVRHICLRTGIVLSTHEGALPRLLLPYRLFVGGPFGSGRQWWSWIHLEDQVRAMQFLVESPSTDGAFNIAAPNPLQNKDFGKAIGRALSRPSLIPVPAFALKLLFGEVATVVLDGQRASVEKLNGLGFQFNFPQAEAAIRDLVTRSI